MAFVQLSKKRRKKKNFRSNKLVDIQNVEGQKKIYIYKRKKKKKKQKQKQAKKRVTTRTTQF